MRNVIMLLVAATSFGLAQNLEVEEAIRVTRDFPIDAKSRQLSQARQNLDDLLSEQTPGYSVEYFRQTFFPAGRGNVRYRFVPVGEHNELWCQARRGKRGVTVWKLKLADITSKSPPKPGTLLRLLFQYGCKPAGTVSPRIRVELDRRLAYAGYQWHIPGNDGKATFFDAHGGSIGEGFPNHDLAGNKSWTGASATYPIMKAERKALGWK